MQAWFLYGSGRRAERLKAPRPQCPATLEPAVNHSLTRDQPTVGVCVGQVGEVAFVLASPRSFTSA